MSEKSEEGREEEGERGRKGGVKESGQSIIIMAS